MWHVLCIINVASVVFFIIVCIQAAHLPGSPEAMAMGMPPSPEAMAMGTPDMPEGMPASLPDARADFCLPKVHHPMMHDSDISTRLA